MIPTRKRSYYITVALALLAGNLLICLSFWLMYKYDKIQIDQFIYSMKTSQVGTNKALAGSAVVRVGVFGVGSTLLEVLIYLLCSGHLKRFFKNSARYLKFCANRVCRFITKAAMPVAMIVLVFSLFFLSHTLHFFQYVQAITTDSDFIEDHFADPDKVKLTFPKHKRNLIYIFLESMEATYADPAAGEPVTDNYIPELSALAEEHVSFSHHEGIGGAYSYTGTTWTAAAMVTQTSGVIVQVPLTAENYGGENDYIPELVSIGDLLAREGYQQTLLLGSNAVFANRNDYFEEHGNYEIVDIVTLKEQGRLPEDYEVWWGYEDEKLFAFAKEELNRMAATGEPFNLTMLTADSHFPDGYVCPLCREEYDRQYPNVLRCSSRQVAEFVAWIQEQPFYENTTIVICGDHLTMDPNLLDGIEEGYTRTVYNCFINAAVEPVNEKNREFGTFDMFPTTLAAMGVRIEGDRLGLGTNLFSNVQTLTERYGFEVLDEEFLKNSEFYNDELLDMDNSEAPAEE